MFQQIILVGNLGRDPEMRFTPAGKPVTSFSVATNRRYNGPNGEKVEETMWTRVTAWDKQAEVCNQYLKKGSKVLIVGRLNHDKDGSPRLWDGQDGKRASFEVTASQVVFLSTRENGDLVQETAGDSGEDIPF